MKRLFTGKWGSIRQKMMVIFIVMTVMTGLVSLYIMMNSNRLMRDIDALFEQSIVFDNLGESLDETFNALTLYVENKSSDALNAYMEHSEDLETQAMALSRYNHTKSDALNFEKIQNMVVNFNSYSADAIVAKRGRDIDACRYQYDLALNTRDNIQMIIQNLELTQIDRNLEAYAMLSESSNKARIYNFIMIIDMLLLIIILVYQATDNMTRPIIKLSQAAKEMTLGHFDGAPIEVQGEDEVVIMAKAFEEMRQSIKAYIEELQNANEIKSQLFEQELQNVKMQTLLNDAELRFLQTQINPHFLFNSLNAGVQLAMIEGADQTLEFLEDMSAIFRYNIKPLEELVKVSEEIDTIKAYCQMMKVRFGDKVSYDIHMPEDLKDYYMLPMILQPIVENAFIHGISKQEHGGAVRVSVERYDDKTLKLIVSDNGGGIPPEKIRRIIHKDSSGKDKLVQPKKSHSTGIGAGNVIQRLKLYYNDSAQFKIDSQMGKGTVYEIHIPIIDV